MKRRILKKIAKKAQRLDATLSECFYQGGHKTYSDLIRALRAEIRYIRRRWPKAYELAFGSSANLSLGHRDSGWTK